MLDAGERELASDRVPEEQPVAHLLVAWVADVHEEVEGALLDWQPAAELWSLNPPPRRSLMAGVFEHMVDIFDVDGEVKLEAGAVRAPAAVAVVGDLLPERDCTRHLLGERYGGGIGPPYVFRRAQRDANLAAPVAPGLDAELDRPLERRTRDVEDVVQRDLGVESADGYRAVVFPAATRGERAVAGLDALEGPLEVAIGRGLDGLEVLVDGSPAATGPAVTPSR